MGWDGAGAYARRAVARRSVHAADEASEMPGGERRTGCPLRRIGAPRAAPALSVGPRLWRECSPESGYKNERARSLAGPKPQPEHELVRVAIPSPHPPRAHSERQTQDQIGNTEGATAVNQNRDRTSQPALRRVPFRPYQSELARSV